MTLAIILTGTVKPGVVGGIFSESERMQMYTDTLRYYAKTIGNKYPIFFVENSNANLSAWNTEFADSLNLKVLQFRPDDAASFKGFDNNRGKGYNEYLMIKKAIMQHITPQR